jgi:hypothetical protein
MGSWHLGISCFFRNTVYEIGSTPQLGPGVVNEIRAVELWPCGYHAPYKERDCKLKASASRSVSTPGGRGRFGK